MESNHKPSGTVGQSQQQDELAPPPSPARSAQRAAGGGDGAERDTPSTNRVSPSYNGEGNVKILLKGIDSLYLSYQGEIDPQISWEIASRKLFAQSRKAEDQAKAQWQVGEHLFEVADKGQRSGASGGFAYILEDAAYRICLSASGSRALPLAYVKVSSAYLAHQRPEAIVEELSAIIETRLCRFLISYITSYMALHRIIDYEQGVIGFLNSARSMQENHCAMRLEIGFDEWIEQQVAVKAKSFNLKLDPRAARDEVDMPEDDELGAIAYYKASRGE